ncbi:2,5-dichloro-2,5-cyclohexadiene-1,4-diol dehydrogenase [Myxococcus stipitatus DSM 14675]|uniref:2,5-dichloro-2,5-cyclohexadiene-1,4-diol dehydrogenase n=1 Tax=Myxococcus stipitatus (strain DSM 14675 / JCM 12634 / Mx s8) TaxID=1278073 RepID=L7U3N3_MYXSD|nr:glucose 1-dehydrogenase [Myxococcus stipitatus]AGC42197.1 2,5-dichloro-2,5-cyclohexadiene-1,4-diol dehydrogenase [Myxococcus stipitatus DSM 14675]
MKRVEGKVALITGAAGGLGSAAARMLAREGARVVVTDRASQEAEGRAVAESLGDGQGLFLALDVTREEDWVRAMEATQERFGRLDVLVNNAGMGIPKDVESLSLEEWRLVHAVNLDGTFLGCKHGIRAMRQCGARGSIINVSSQAGLMGVPSLAAYASAKGAVRMFTKTVALHCAEKGYGIRCNSIHPTFIETNMVKALLEASGAPDRAREGMRRSIPLGSLGEPDDVAHGIVYLASDESKLMTGAELVLDGGGTA